MQLIYCWTICCNFTGVFIVVDSASVLSVEKVLGWGLELNLGIGERKCGFFGEVLDLEVQISLQCFCVVGEILWKSCVVDGDTIGGAATGFGVGTLGSFKMGGYCDVSAEEAFDKINQV